MNNIGRVENIENPDTVRNTWRLYARPVCNKDMYSIQFIELISVLVDRLSRKACRVPAREITQNLSIVLKF